MKIYFFYFFLVVGKITGIVPWFIKRNTFSHRTWNNVYPTFIFGTIISIYSLYLPEASTKRIGVVIHFLFLFTTWNGTIRKVNTWKKFVILNEITDKKLKNDLGIEIDINWKNTIPLFCYIVGVILLLSLSSVIEVYMLSLMLQKYFLMYFVILFLNVLKEKLKVLNSGFNCLYNPNIDFYYFKNLFKNFFEISVCCNELFGWNIGIFLLDFFCFICSTFNFVVGLVIIGRLPMEVGILLGISYVVNLVSKKLSP